MYMKNSQKGFIVPLLIAIVAVLAIGGGVYVYEQNKKPDVPKVVDAGTQQSAQNQSQTNTQTPPVSTQKTTAPVATNPTAGWKTYSNSQYGFELKYPQEWKVEGPSGGPYVGFQFSGKPGDSKEYLYLTVWKNKFSDLDSAVSDYYKKGYRDLSTINFITFNGYRAAIIPSSPNCVNCPDSYGVWLENNGYLFDIPKIISTTPPIVQQILSTFKFKK